MTHIHSDEKGPGRGLEILASVIGFYLVEVCRSRRNVERNVYYTAGMLREDDGSLPGVLSYGDAV